MLLKIRCYLSHKEQGFTFSLENTILEKVRAIVKIWSKRKISRKSEFSVYGIVQSCKLGDLKKYTLTFKFLSQLIFCHFASKLQSTTIKSELWFFEANWNKINNNDNDNNNNNNSNNNNNTFLAFEVFVSAPFFRFWI